MTLTHNGGPEWADSALNRDGTIVHEPTKGGLTSFGRKVVGTNVQSMQNSHASSKTMAPSAFLRAVQLSIALLSKSLLCI